MILYAEHRSFTVSHAFDGAVIEIDVGHFHIGRQTGGIDRKTMILAGDADLATAQIFDRLIATAMTKFEFEGFATVGVT